MSHQLSREGCPALPGRWVTPSHACSMSRRARIGRDVPIWEDVSARASALLGHSEALTVVIDAILPVLMLYAQHGAGHGAARAPAWRAITPLPSCQTTICCATCTIVCSAMIPPCWDSSLVRCSNRAYCSCLQISVGTMKAIVRAVSFP